MGGTYTPNLHLYKPLKGEVGWDAAVNANFDTLDSTIEALEVQVGGLVTSVFGRTGAVVSQTGDYSFSQISGKAGLAQGGTNADLSATGGASQVLKQVSAGAPITVGQLAVSDISGISAIAGSGAWSALQNASANLTLSNAGFTTEFDQTSAASWKWKNTTTATSGTTNASPPHLLAANYWTGAASAEDSWTLQSTLAAGTNGIPNLSITHSGSTGVAQIKAPAVIGIYGWAGGLGGVGPGGGGNTNQVGISIGGTETFRFTGSYLNMGPSGIAWAATLGTPDTGLYRLGAASLGIGNGTAGDFSGALTLGALNQTNPTVATSGTTNASPIQTYSANYWTGAASAVDTWTVQSSLAAGTNGASTLTIAHAGSTGNAILSTPAMIAIASASPASIASNTLSNQTGFLYWTGTSGIFLADSAGANFRVGFYVQSGRYNLSLNNAGLVAWTSSATAGNTAADTAFSRLAAGSLALGNGTASDKTGTLSVGTLIEGTTLTPTSAATAGVTGQIAWDATNIYVCTAGGAAGAATWKKAALAAA